MRILEGHNVNPVNDQLELTVMDEPGQGNACHRYEVRLPDGLRYAITFQDGPINEVGVNGLTHEVLLAILIDRLEGFQDGKFANVFNAGALDHLRAAQNQLQQRTKERMERGIEGTHAV